MQTTSLQIIVHGKVQGVWFRASTREMADKLSLKGTVKNLPDGSVEINVYGPADKVAQLINWARSGPERAIVDHLESREIDYQDMDSFDVIR